MTLVTQLSVSKKRVMAGVEALSRFFRLFEVFCLHNFSFSELEITKQSKRSKFCHKIYFVVLLLMFSTLMTFYVVVVVEKTHEEFNARTFILKSIKSLVNFALICAMICGLIEASVNSNKTRDVIKTAREIKNLCESSFGWTICYKNLKKTLIKKIIFCFFVFEVYLFGLMILELLVGEPITGMLLGIAPQHFIGTIMIFFNFYIELVNFQLKNLVQIVSTSLRYENILNCNPINHELISKVGECFKTICEMADTVNKILRRAVFIVFLILVVITICLIYENLVLIFQGIVIPNKHYRKLYKLIFI